MSPGSTYTVVSMLISLNQQDVWAFVLARMSFAHGHAPSSILLRQRVDSQTTCDRV